MKKEIAELNLNINDKDSIFNKKYIVPIYQRAYSWKKEEIKELIDDLLKIKSDKYYLGYIVVTSDKDLNYYLIDGQQRITTLYLLYIYLGLINDKKQMNLSYEIRDNSDFEKIIDKDFIKNNKKNEIQDGYINIENVMKDIVKDKNEIIGNLEEAKEILKNNLLNKVFLYQMELNNKTNLNHYFEVMNSRGVQLERADIVKAKLMSKLNDSDMKKFSELWYALSNMNVPLSENKNISLKKHINFSEIFLKNKKNDFKPISINDILNDDKKIEIQEEKTINDNTALSFNYFLLYAKRLYKDKDKANWSIKENAKSTVYSDYDEKDMLNEFKDDEFKDEKSVKDFIYYLYELRKIYDQFIISRIDDEWSINNILNSKASDIYKQLIKIESCLRVSFTSRKSMHWVYETLGYFYSKKNISKTALINDYIKQMEYYISYRYIKEYLQQYIGVKDNFIDAYESGFDTPHIVLNYLDYILYNLEKEKYSGFQFKYRTSIEHFLPRNNEEGIINDSPVINKLGNLCLMGTRENSHLSNATPAEKSKRVLVDKDRFSIKLYLMAKKAQYDDKMSEIWIKESMIHQKLMITKLFKNMKRQKIDLENEERIKKYINS